MTDVELLRQWRAMRDAQAFRQIVARYGGLIYGTCRRILADPTEAEDVTQDCFIYLASRPPRIHTSLGAWLHRLATHRSYDRLKSSGRRRAREERFAGETPATTGTSMNDILDHVDEAVNQLPDKYRHVLVSHYYLDKSHADIARELGLSRRAVGYRIDKGLTRLREHLKRAGITTPAAALTGFMSSNLCEAVPATLVTKIGSMAVAGAATTPSTAAATMLATFGFSKAAISLGLALLLAAAAWWGGTALFADKKEATVVSTAASTIPALSSPQEPLEDTVAASRAVTEPETQSSPPEALVATGQIEPDLGSISGKVIDSEGTPLPGWTVRARGEDRSELSKTDESGAFTLAGLASGEYEVYARDQDRFSRVHASSKVALRPGEDVSELIIVYDLEQSLSGYISSTDGQPINDARVSSSWTRDSASPRRRIVTSGARSDASGQYVVFGMPESQEIQVSLMVTHQDFIQSNRWDVVVDGTEQDFTLFEKPTIEGVVLDAESHEPITEYRLHGWMGNSFNENESMTLAVRRQRLKKHPEGQFSYRPVGFNQVRIAVSAPGYATGVHRLEDVQPGETVRDVEILLTRVVPLAGTVLDSDGDPVQGAYILLGHPGMVAGDVQLAFPDRERSAQTDSDGAFVITEYPTSLEVISAYHAEYAPAWTNVPRPFAPVEIVLTKGGQLEGFITYGGAPLEDERSHVNVVTGESQLMLAYTGDGGYYAHEKVPTGFLTVWAGFHEGGLRRYIHRDVNVRPGETLRQDFDFSDAYDSYIEGRVLLNGNPPWVANLSAIVHFGNGDRVHYQTSTAGDGSYRLGPIPAAAFEFGADSIRLRDLSYLELTSETVTTRPGETTRHDISFVTE